MDTETQQSQQNMQTSNSGLGTLLIAVLILGIFGYVFFVSAGNSFSSLFSQHKTTDNSNQNELIVPMVSQINNDIEIGDSIVVDDERYFVFTNDEVQTTVESESANDIPMCGNYPCYSDEEFLSLYNVFEKSLELPLLSKYIYQDTDADTYIKNFAEKRGYRARPFANEVDIIPFEGITTRLEVKKAYTAMRDEMLEQGIRLHFVSGYRDSTAQRAIFKEKMGPVIVSEIPTGSYDTQLDTVLSTSALPAYSKHHSGYAVDFGCGNDYLVYKFSETPCFQWLSENNFENAKRFGFIPSYPEDAPVQGPNPEPWEFVWVGEDTIQEKAI